MDKEIQTVSEAMSRLAEDAHNLMSVTANVAGVRVGDARKRLAAALERGKQVCSRLKTDAIEGAKAADEAVHMHPYQAIAIGVGLGAVLGYLIGRQGSRNGE